MGAVGLHMLLAGHGAVWMAIRQMMEVDASCCDGPSVQCNGSRTHGTLRNARVLRAAGVHAASSHGRPYMAAHTERQRQALTLSSLDS